MSVIWSETASEQLRAIRDYLARSSPGYAQSLAERIVSRCESLDGRPLFGAEVSEYGDPKVREVYEHPYRIIYRHDDQDVQFVAILHSARRLPRTPPG